MKRTYLNYFLLGIFIFLLLAGVSSYSVNAEASPLIKMNPGQSKKMILPKGWKRAKWSSSKKTVARINSKGVVKAVSPGKAVITASVFKKKYKCTVTVEYEEMKDSEKPKDSEKIKDSEKRKDGEKMKIQVGDTTFTATLAENSSVDALKELMADGPLTLNMSDYANMEKGADLGVTLPQNNEQMNTQAGDVILYQGRTIVIYYDTNSWRLTPIGKIDNVDPKKLRTVLGAGDVTVTFSLE